MIERNRSQSLKRPLLAVGLALAIFGGIALLIFSFQRLSCDVHEQREATSRGGRWTAVWKTEGCHGLLFLTDFDSSISIIDHRNAAAPPVMIYRSDGPDPVRLSWPQNDSLHVEVDSVSEISQSRRTIPGMTITYSVSAQVMDVLKYQADRWKHPDPEEAQETAHLSKADQKAEQEVAQTYHEYIERFRTWVSDYATGTPNIPK